MFTRERNSKCCIVLVYVDDLIITGDDVEVKEILDKAFSIKNLGNLRYFLGIEVARGNKGTMLNQRKYALDILKDTGVEDCLITKFHFIRVSNSLMIKVNY